MNMPVITVEIASLTKAQKEQLAAELTKSASRITGIPENAYYTFIREYNSENIAVGGTLMSNK